MTTSATGGYLLPTASSTFPDRLTLTQFIQSVLVGISGLPGQLCRPRWQLNPPKQPDLNVNWLAFGITLGAPNANAYVNMDAEQNTISQRHQDLKINCAFYGPEAMEYANIVTDGFQIPQNLEALTLANMGYVSTGQILSIPDLVNERWLNRFEMEVNLRREIQRTYSVLNFLSSHGNIRSVLPNEQEYNSAWQAPQEG